MDDTWQQITALVIAIAVAVIGRLVDKYLPDPDERHPLPSAPVAAETATTGDAAVVLDDAPVVTSGTTAASTSTSTSTSTEETP